MSKLASTLSKKDRETRDFILGGDMWHVVLALSLPLAMYNGLNHLFSFLDTMMAAHIGSSVVSAIAYLAQIKTMITSVGAGLALGGGIIIARYYGADDMKNTQKYVNTLLFLAIAISLLLLLFILPFTKPILIFVNTPEELITVGNSYFIVEILMLTTIFINNVYMAIEKAKGNSKLILRLNLMVLALKLILTALFVYVFNLGIVMMAVATLLAHLSLTLVGLSNMLRAEQMFRISIRKIDLSKKTLWPILTLALPIFFEKFTFSLGKVIVNSMSTLYGSMVVGALGISNNVAGIPTSLSNGFQDGEAAIISQNLGNNNLDRALDSFKKTVAATFVIGLLGMLFIYVFMEPIVHMFVRGELAFFDTTLPILKYEIYALIPLTTTSAVMGLLYGFGYTKLSLVINFLRLFLFRIPSLYLLQNYTHLGSKGVGIAMMVSNGLMGITALIIAFIVIRKMKLKEGNPYKNYILS
ncbi:MAG: MATE family efflux transporter [Thermotaleaceae bacterium]